MAALHLADDGRGAELQVNYLPEELGGKLRPSDKWPGRPTGDGLLASRILLAWPPSPPVPAEATSE